MFKNETHKRIYETTKEIVLKRGFSYFSLEILSKKMKISKSSLYHYFKTKKSLILFVLKCEIGSDNLRFLFEIFTDLQSLFSEVELNEIIDFFNENYTKNFVYAEKILFIKEKLSSLTGCKE